MEFLIQEPVLCDMLHPYDNWGFSVGLQNPQALLIRFISDWSSKDTVQEVIPKHVLQNSISFSVLCPISPQKVMLREEREKQRFQSEVEQYEDRNLKVQPRETSLPIHPMSA